MNSETPLHHLRTLTNKVGVRTSLILLLSLIPLFAIGQTDEQLFTSPFSTPSGDRPYRIPAIVQTSNDDVLVFADKRYGGGDVGQVLETFSEMISGKSKHTRIDLVYRRWDGTEWGDETTIVTGKDDYGYGDAAVVADRENPNNIVLFCAAGNVFFTKGQLKCHRFRSSDGGVSWTNSDVTTDIYNALGNDYASAFFSSGRICQSSRIKVGTHYRLYAALCVRGTNSVVLYSDDFGGTWKQLGGVAVDGGNEAKCEELPNGSVLVSSRNGDGRYYRVYNYNDDTYTSGSWEEKIYTVLSGKDGGATNGEVLIVPAADKDGATCNILLQSLPAESGRKKVTIYWQKLSSDVIESASTFTGEWGSYQVSSQTSAYSSMTWQADGNIGFVWEDYHRTLVKDGYNIEYRNLPLSTITGGKYTNVMTKTMSKVPASCDREWCNGSSYSTMYLPYGVKLPEGVKAFTGTIEGSVLTIHELEGGVVPAMTAVLLEDEECRTSIDLTMVNTSKRVTENDLEGTLTAMTIENKADYLVMGHGSKHIGFYRPNSTTLKANAVFIPVSKVNATSLAIKRGDATSITDIVLENDADKAPVYYDLMGRRVVNPTRGIYIVNGKKVLVR